MKRLLLLALLLCIVGGLSGQEVRVVAPSLLNEAVLRLRIKQIEEFMARFTHPTDRMARPLANLGDAKAYEAGIEMLVEATYRRKHVDAVRDFAQAVSKSKTPLRFTDAFWYAELQCDVKYRGQAETVTLYLRVEPIAQLRYKWVLVWAEGPCLSQKPKRSNPGLIISPVEHELNFMSLVDLLNTAPSDGQNYCSRTYKPDMLSVFLALMRAGVLTFEGVRDIRYHFFQVPGYIFRVGHFERQGTNVGWLIDSISTCRDEDKLLGREHLFKD